MTRCKDPVAVEVEPNTVMAAARHGGQVSSGRVGNSVNSSGLPIVQTETVLGTVYIFDVIPNLSGGRVINLATEADKSSAVSIMTSYDPTTTPERSNLGSFSLDPRPWQSPERSHSLFVQFGAGNARHSFEIDVAQGSPANCPGSHVEVTLLDYTFLRANAQLQVAVPDEASSKVLVSHANVSAFAHPFAARFTEKVLAPYQVAVDLADPPNFDDFLNSLLLANVLRTYL